MSTYDLSKIPAEHTARYYRMNPETDDLIGEGKNLQNGMIVLAEESSLLKGDPFPGGDDKAKERYNRYDAKRYDENNRWCMVTELKVTPRFEGGYDPYTMENDGPRREGSPLVSFVGVYADGTKAKRSMDSTYAWFVKKDTIPEPTDDDIMALADSLVDDFFGGLFKSFFAQLGDSNGTFEVVNEGCTICSPDDTVEEATQKHADFEAEKRGEQTGFENEPEQPMPHWEKELLNGRDGDPEHEPDEDGNCKQCDENEARRNRESEEALAALRAKLTGNENAGGMTPPTFYPENQQ